MSPIRSSSSISAASSPAARRAISSVIRGSSRPISALPLERPDGRGLMLEISSLHTGYGDVGVLHGIDLTVGAGEIVALIGANGAGKSTLAKAISGLLPAWAGEIRFDGARIDRLSSSERVRRGIAQVPEGRQVIAGLSVGENLRLGAYVRRRALGEAGMARRIDE